MPIKIDHSQAKSVLYEEHAKAHNGVSDPICEAWKAKVDRLGALCPYRKSSTFVAALGTALLAKSVEPNVDVYSLLDRDGGERSYSARSLADNVWAKNRAYLDVDLGANNANPLNNTPFVGRARIDAIERVRNVEGRNWLFACLDELDSIQGTEEARSALRGFILSRTVVATTSFNVGENAGDYFVSQSLATRIEEFVGTDSEEGRRAQAVAAGLLSVAFGTENVEVSHINDPDRRFPLDITVFDDPVDRKVRFSVEVKDKKVSGSDVLSSVEKVVKFDIPNVLYLALSQPHDQRDFEAETVKARDSGCRVIFCYSWEQLCNMCTSMTATPGPGALGEAFRQIGARLVQLGVSQAGIGQWESWSG
uniref:restriction endonuclease, SacI family n=1 Tax=Microbulbifer agarilyticus TaxID=260552 RepID=UPI00025586D9|nr:restriction endonuclease, SacI family [Microbulbifer agarilyticus]